MYNVPSTKSSIHLETDHLLKITLRDRIKTFSTIFLLKPSIFRLFFLLILADRTLVRNRKIVLFDGTDQQLRDLGFD